MRRPVRSGSSLKSSLRWAWLSLALPCGALAAKPPDWVAELAPAQAAMARADHAGARQRLERLAGHNPLAQMLLGMAQRDGWGRAPDPVAACAWFDKAAHRHIPAAEHFWGDCLAQGIGRAVDIPGALAWYERAAEHGHLISWCAAADHLVRGEGVARDVPRGIALCTQAAQAQSPPAMLWLARHHDHGGTAEDLPTARHWYQAAARHQVPEARHRLGLMLAQGEGGPVDLDGALFWLESAAEQGHAPAYLPTALLYAQAPPDPDPDTGALPPAHLAKVYLWTEAAKARATDPAQQAQAGQLEAQALAVMPAAWRVDLDRQVATHLAQHRP